MNVLLAMFDSMGAQEMLVVGVIAILLFGEKLPEVGRKVGKTLTEFKRSVRGIQDEFTGALTGVERSVDSATSSTRKEVFDDRDEATAPKFVPPPPPPRETQPEQSHT
jgi:sec-independent protein translocase protein TatA